MTYPVDDSYKIKFYKGIYQYRKFRKIYLVNKDTSIKQGKIIIHFEYNQYIFQDMKSSELNQAMELNMKFVRIYFDATTFDRITKDRAAKFADMLSAIGGTMGLLTGFSILSGVEILYFGVKIILDVFKK